MYMGALRVIPFVRYKLQCTCFIWKLSTANYRGHWCKRVGNIIDSFSIILGLAVRVEMILTPKLADRVTLIHFFQRSGVN